MYSHLGIRSTLVLSSGSAATRRGGGVGKGKKSLHQNTPSPQKKKNLVLFFNIEMSKGDVNLMLQKDLKTDVQFKRLKKTSNLKLAIPITH